MPRVIADGRTKLTIVTTKPTNIFAPTVTELNAGIDLSCKVLSNDFLWSATDSDKIAEKALCDEGNANALGASNFQARLTLWRYFLTAGGVDTTADSGFTALKTKGATLWGYARKTDKKATAAWATGDEIYLGGEFTVDNAQVPSDISGWEKWTFPLEPQSFSTFFTATT